MLLYGNEQRSLNVPHTACWRLSHTHTHTYIERQRARQRQRRLTAHVHLSVSKVVQLGAKRRSVRYATHRETHVFSQNNSATSVDCVRLNSLPVAVELEVSDAILTMSLLQYHWRLPTAHHTSGWLIVHWYIYTVTGRHVRVAADLSRTLCRYK